MKEGRVVTFIMAGYSAPRQASFRKERTSARLELSTSAKSSARPQESFAEPAILNEVVLFESRSGSGTPRGDRKNR